MADEIRVAHPPRDKTMPRAKGLKALKHGLSALRGLYRFHTKRADWTGSGRSMEHAIRADELAEKIINRERAIHAIEH